MTAVHPSALVSIAVVALIAWRLYRKVRRMVGRQPLRIGRAWLTVVFFPVILGLLALTALVAPMNGLALLAGGAIGAGLGVWGLRLTRFEATPAGLFYTPNLHLGIALSLLFVGRIAYRIVMVALAGQALADAQPLTFTRSPLTLAIFATLAAYYTAYAAGLIAWRGRAQRAAPAPLPPAQTVAAAPAPGADPLS